ncbi:MAG TPA: translation initiation factor IF-2 [Polyangiaceae bacterium]|nr:translation initiation factor IF-2 [Polyangiaceae bacterium]
MTGRATPPPKTGIEVWQGRPGVPMPPPPQTSTPGGRRTTYDMRGGQVSTPARPGMPANRPGGPGGRPGMGGRPGGPNRGRPGMGPIRKGPVAVSTKEMGADKKVIRIEEKVGLQVLAQRMSLKATEVLMKLIQLGMTGVNINTTLDADTAKIVAGEFGWEVEDVAQSEATQLSQARGPETKDEGATELRAPIITVMGHVDHGKTSLLDQIRKTNVAGGEAGGITQHIGAYRVQTSRGPICFLDTPGHEAFTAMRARGAGVTDIVVLVVAADDGVMPQTREAVAHALAAKVPIVVAVNKVDKPEADPDRVKRQLMELNEALVPEEYGGRAAYMPVSAKTRQGVDELLERLALEAEVLELRANPKRPGHGTVIEALLDRGKGPVARILVTDGTLSTGDYVLAGPAFGKVRAMTDDRGRAVTSAGPATPVEVLGLTEVPNAGDSVDAVKDPKKAQEIADARKNKIQQVRPTTAKVTLEQLAEQARLKDQVEQRVIVKGDVQGSVEAIVEALQRLSGDKVKLTIVHASVGAITEGDINLAIASKALVIGFNVRPAGKAAGLAESEGIEIRQYNIIYNLIDDVRGAMEGLLAPTLIERPLGKAEVRQVFKLSKAGVVAGCMVTEGEVKRSAKARLRRGTELVFEGKISGLKRFKDDVREVKEGFECGISLENFDAIKEGDVIEAYELEEVRTKL